MPDNTITIATDFAPTPGARHISDGPYSGQLFREQLLQPWFNRNCGDEMLTIILDGTEGYATSFLEEAFGGLARAIGVQVCLDRIRFVSHEDGLLIDEIIDYIRHAKS